MQHGHYFVPRTFVGPKPGDFPLGSLHSRAAARAIVAEYLDVDREKEDAALAGLTPAAQACIEGQVVDNALVRRWMIYLARFAEERARVCELESPFFPLKGKRRAQEVAEEINQMNGARGSILRDGNHDNWTKLKAISGQNFRAKKKLLLTPLVVIGGGCPLAVQLSRLLSIFNPFLFARASP